MYMPRRVDASGAHRSVPEIERVTARSCRWGRSLPAGIARRAELERVAATARGRLDHIGAGIPHPRCGLADGVARATAGRDPGRVPPPSLRSQSKTAVTARRSRGWAGSQSSRAGARNSSRRGLRASRRRGWMSARGPALAWRACTDCGLRLLSILQRSSAILRPPSVPSSGHDNDVARTGGGNLDCQNPVTEIASIARAPCGTEHVVSAGPRQTPQIDPDSESECRTTPLFSLLTVTQSRQNRPGIHTSISRTEGLKHEIQ